MQTAEILQSVEHRPFPLHSSAWIMTQRWKDVLFAHWSLTPEELRPFVPSALSLDTFEDQCWLTITPFSMSHVAPRGFPPIPALSDSYELNVRTYVIANGIPGIYFFSLDASNPLMVLLARHVYSLPYFKARMHSEQRGNLFFYSSVRTDPKGLPATFIARYQPHPAIFQAERGTLDYWLLERYCLYTVIGRQKILRAHIHHRPWELQKARMEILYNSMTLAARFPLPEQAPLLHYSQVQDVLVWPIFPTT
uniref:DUF2071 domain-containing protein n=1 Tax=Thermosporothrix sp. COM3 TaxID=2490863 RepID=A0A455SCX3_9CHLR|nr:hypothetical protein KTC_03570 [Thermosporothrix sp. COM3]